MTAEEKLKHIRDRIQEWLSKDLDRVEIARNISTFTIENIEYLRPCRDDNNDTRIYKELLWHCFLLFVQDQDRKYIDNHPLFKVCGG